MRRTVPSRRDRPDGNCGRLVGRQGAAPEGHLARGDAQRRLVESRGSRTREEAVAYVWMRAGPSSPASTSRSACRNGSRARTDARRSMTCGRSRARDGDAWLAPTPPFWRDRGDVPPEQAVPQVRGALPDREVDLPARRQRSGRRGIRTRHAAHRAAARSGIRDLAVRCSDGSRPRSRSIRRHCASTRRITTRAWQNERRARRRRFRAW